MFTFRNKGLFHLTMPLVAVLVAGTLSAQSSTVVDDLISWTETTVDGLPGAGSGDFDVPTAAEQTGFANAVRELLEEDLTAAELAAAAQDYEIVTFHDTGAGGEMLYGLFPDSTNTDHRGYYFVRPQAQVLRDLVIEAPHPLNDRATAERASELFRESGARALAIAGAHRCANPGLSGCDGTTSACGASGGFRESDMAHTEESFFQAFHETLNDEEAAVSFLQLHGFGSDPGEPDFSISDGTNFDTSDLTHTSNAFAIDLQDRLDALYAPASPPKLGNSCNLDSAAAGEPTDLNFKCGTTNTQGRYTNGSTVDACDDAATSSAERFFHVEMSHEIRGNTAGDPRNFQLVIDTVLALFPATGSEGEIGDFIWSDADRDGLQDAGENGIGNVTVELHQGAVHERTVVTGSSGAYLFRALDAGTYRVRVLEPTGFTYGQQDAGDDTLDSDVDETTGFTGDIVLAVDQSLTTIDAAFEGPCVLEKTLVAEEVTYLDESRHSSSKDGDEMQFDGVSGGVLNRESGLVAWPISGAGFPSDADVIEVEMTLEFTNKTSDTYFAYQMLRSWNESQATWDAPESGGSWGSAGATSIGVDRASTVLTSVTSSSTGDRTFDLNASGIAVVQGWIDGTITNYGLIIPGENTSQSDGADVTDDPSSKAPRLRVVYETSQCGS